jgi:hypothetical protein
MTRTKKSAVFWIRVEAGSKDDALAVARNQGYEPTGNLDRIKAQEYDVEVVKRITPEGQWS